MGQIAPLISIIIPVYNVEHYIEECLDSICGQSYHNIEILVVDDGSTDNSGNICDLYKEKDKRIRVYHKENGGLSSARNLGLEYAHGDYISFVDSDDFIRNDMIESLYAFMSEECCEIAECAFGNNCDKSVGKYKILNKHEALKEYLSSQYFYPNVSVCNKLYKAQIIKELKFPVGKIHEDYLFQTMALNSVKNYGFVNDEMYNYRVREESITHRVFDYKDFDKIDMYKKRTEFLLECGYYDLVKISKNEELIILFSLYWKSCLNKISEKNLLDSELKQRRKEFFKSNIAMKRKLVYFLFYVNPRIYVCVRTLIDRVDKSER